MELPEIKFDEKGLVPVVTQDALTREVLMVAYMDKEALAKTIETKKAHYYSRSRKSLWLKGETSGNFQEVLGLRYDCDADTLLLLVRPLGPACHTGENTCFYRSIIDQKLPAGASMIKDVFDIAVSRKSASADTSYVASLFAKGEEKILAKVAEESAELIEAARIKEDKDTVYELVDLWFHTIVLLAKKDIPIEGVFEEFARRFGLSGIEEKASRKK